MCYMVHIDQQIKDRLAAIEELTIKVSALAGQLSVANLDLMGVIDDLNMHIQCREEVIDREMHEEAEERGHA